MAIVRGLRLRSPTFGATCIVLGEVVLIVVLSLYGFNVKDRWSYEDIGYRTGFVSVCQLPLLFLLAGKKNIIGYLTGMSYEKLNWLHRWSARVLLLSVTIHMGYWFADWAPYDYIGTQLTTFNIARNGFIAWCVLVWIVVSGATPIRGWAYEFFVFQHVASFAVFVGFVYLHVPDENRIWIWLSVGFFFFDRAVRALNTLYLNLSFFHPKQRKEGKMSPFWACKADFTPLPHDTTRITIHSPPTSWKPGQHVFLSCHSMLPLQSHPFTIASLPEDGKMEFLVKAEKGGTRSFFKHATKQQQLPMSGNTSAGVRAVAIEGPYGAMRSLRQFDSAILISGSTGAAFTIPLMRDLLNAWKKTGQAIVTRHVRLVWIVKSRGQLAWFASQLSAAMEDAEELRKEGHDIELDISVYITCDESFTEEHKSLLSSHTAAMSSKPQHGVVEEVTPEANEKNELKKTEERQEVREIEPRTVPKTCGPNGTCCCTSTIASEADAITSTTCTCKRQSLPTSSAASTSSGSDGSQKLCCHPSISILAGRPHCRNIIQKSLEQALGESAVVVCGPTGLREDVRRAVVGLSDERAVHKGTGAQGIYLHVEGFGY